MPLHKLKFWISVTMAWFNCVALPLASDIKEDTAHPAETESHGTRTVKAESNPDKAQDEPKSYVLNWSPETSQPGRQHQTALLKVTCRNLERLPEGDPVLRWRQPDGFVTHVVLRPVLEGMWANRIEIPEVDGRHELTLLVTPVKGVAGEADLESVTWELTLPEGTVENLQEQTLAPISEAEPEDKATPQPEDTARKDGAVKARSWPLIGIAVLVMNLALAFLAGIILVIYQRLPEACLRRLSGKHKVDETLTAMLVVAPEQSEAQTPEAAVMEPEKNIEEAIAKPPGPPAAAMALQAETTQILDSAEPEVSEPTRAESRAEVDEADAEAERLAMAFLNTNPPTEAPKPRAVDEDGMPLFNSVTDNKEWEDALTRSLYEASQLKQEVAKPVVLTRENVKPPDAEAIEFKSITENQDWEAALIRSLQQTASPLSVDTAGSEAERSITSEQASSSDPEGLPELKASPKIEDAGLPDLMPGPRPKVEDEALPEPIIAEREKEKPAPAPRMAVVSGGDEDEEPIDFENLSF